MWPFFYAFLLYYVAGATATLDAAPKYSVVVTSSPQSPVPFSVGVVHLTCSITPVVPPGIVEYRWDVVPQQLPYYFFHPVPRPYTPNVSLPYARSYISYRSPRFPSYYCHVYSNGIKITSGKLTLKIQGFLQYVTSPVIQFTPGDNVILQFNVSNHLYASSIKTIHWFYRGWCIDCYSYDQYQLDLNNTKLTITNASENDIGQYEVRVTELNHFSSDPSKCDPLTLEVLQHQAVFASLVFHLSVTENSANNNIANVKVLHYYGYINQALTVNGEYEKPNPFRSRYFIMYSDGKLANYLTSSGGPFYGTNESHLMIHVPQYNESWAGDYTIVSYANCHDVIRTLLSGCDYSHRFVCHVIDLYYILDSVLQVSIATLEPPLVEIKSVYTAVWKSSIKAVTFINCSAEGGNPEEYTVQLLKEGEQLMSTTSGPAVLLYSPSHYQQQFGLFTCSVVNEYFNINKSVLIQERASVHTLWLFNSLQTELQEAVEQIDDVFIKLMNSLCQSCNITTSNINNSNATLYNTVKMIQYTSDLIYSSLSGDITSSTLIDLTQQWLLQSESNITLHINNTELRMSKLCMLQVNPTTMDTCHQVIEYLSKTQTSKTLQISSVLMVGGGGALLGITLSVIGVIVIKVSCCICKRKKNPSESDNQEDIELDLNPSYSTTSHQSNLRYEEFASDPQYITQEQSAYANTSIVLCSNDKTRLV